MKNETFTDLMPTINPNLDEVVDGNEPIPIDANPPKNNEIFICSNKVLKKSTKVEELQEPIKVEVKEKKKYPHLEKARATALANRQRKAREKAELKSIADAEKIELKEQKKQLRVEKNRKNNRENYRKKKGLDEEDKTAVTNDKQALPKLTPGKMGLSYDEFERYMDTYNKKKVVNKPIKVEEPKKILPKALPKALPKPKPVLPVNSYWNPHQRNKIDMDDLFSL